jgi:uncharacterized membrane protein YidH (DUF202 family)
MAHGAERAVRQVRRALDGRRLIWFGTRGEDAEPLEGLPELAGSFALIAPLRRAERPYEMSVCLEALRGSRPDTYRYELDDDRTEAARLFRRQMLEAVDRPCVVMTYGSTELVSALAFSMGETVTLGGQLKQRQAAFGHKPWVERGLREHGVRGVGWRYVADEHRASIRELVAGEPRVLRANRTAGGVGLTVASRAEDVDLLWPEGADFFIAVAPLVEGTPINLSGCVFGDGSVRLHPASVQLIGLRSCTDQRFGYCGNDFAALPALLDSGALDEVDRMGREVGSWLHRERYLGAFGIDAIVAGDGVVFTELNARFQGSSVLSATIAQELGASDLYLDHLAASLGLPPPSTGLSIGEWAARQPALSRVVVHNTAAGQVIRRSGESRVEAGPEARVSQLAEGLPVDPGGALFSLTLRRPVTRTGFDLDSEAERLVGSLKGSFAPAGGRRAPRPSPTRRVADGTKATALFYVPRMEQSPGPSRRTILANERTQLAWWRTGLTAIAVALGVGRVVPELANTGSRWPYTLIGFGFAVYGIALIVYGTRRSRAFEAEVGGPGAREGDAVFFVLTAAGVLLGAASAVLILFS